MALEYYQRRNGKLVPIDLDSGSGNCPFTDGALADFDERLTAMEAGKISLSDAVDLDSSEQAASSKAVKIAYDKAVDAETSADAAGIVADNANALAQDAKSLAEQAQNGVNEAKTGVNEAKAAIPQPATATPKAPGTAAIGTSARWAREDHVHPSDKVVYSPATQSANGLMSAADKKKLDGIAAGAQVNNTNVIAKTGARGALAGSETASILTGSQTITASSPDCVNLSTSGAVTLTFTPAAADVRAVKALSLTASAATTLTISGAVWASKGTAPTWGNAGCILVLLAHFVGGRVVLSVADNTQ